MVGVRTLNDTAKQASDGHDAHNWSSDDGRMSSCHWLKDIKTHTVCYFLAEPSEISLIATVYSHTLSKKSWLFTWTGLKCFDSQIAQWGL